MSELAEKLVRKYLTIDPDYVRAVVSLKEHNVNQRFLTSDSEATPQPTISVWKRIAMLFTIRSR